MFTRPRQDANDSLSVLRPWCNAIRVRTPPVLAVSDTIGVNKLTARGIVVRYAREGRIAERPRGGQNNVRVDEEMKESLSDIVNENCLLTLSQINQELRQRLRNKHEIHDRTVSRTLQGMLYWVKQARPLPAERNRPNVIHKRYDYSCWFMRHAVVNHCVFIDECGYNISTARNQGRARTGESYLQLSLRAKRAKCYRGTCHFFNQWPRILSINYRWYEWAEVQWLLGSDKAEPRP